MATKRPYTLSDAARTQRRLASQAAQAKRGIKPIRSHSVPVPSLPDIYAPLPKDAPHSEHQRRAALIRGRRIRNGTLNGSKGGRDRKATKCLRCPVVCESAREARDHCRVARAMAAKETVTK